MKYIFTLCLTCMCLVLFSQSKEYKIAHNGGKLILDGVDDASITAYDGNEIVFSINMHKHDDEEMERSKGLKVINSQGLNDNTNIGLSVNKENGNVLVTQIGECQCSDNKGYTIKIPKSMSIEFSHSTYNSDHLRIYKVEKEIVVSTNYTNVDLVDVTGPMSIKTVYGDIEAKFSTLKQEGTVSLYSVYGLVDAAFPSSTKATLDLKTPYGQIFTDFDIKVESNSKMREYSDKIITGLINGGGLQVSLKSGYDNIYLRKK